MFKVLFKSLHTNRRRLLFGSALALALFVGLSNYWIISRSAPALFDDLAAIPAQPIGLVLGTSEFTAAGTPNLHFISRINAAAQLYHAGKVRHLLVSGDNHTVGYNEPKEMRAALLRRGIPDNAITCDYAGLRTLDSIVRARRIFGVTKMTIVSQRYHNTRALAIARYEGVEAIAFCAQDVIFRHSIKTELREIAARSMAVLDLYVIRRSPRFLGSPEPLPVTG